MIPNAHEMISRFLRCLLPQQGDDGEEPGAPRHYIDSDQKDATAEYIAAYTLVPVR